jgi:hypothetical protein
MSDMELSQALALVGRKTSINSHREPGIAHAAQLL